MYYSQMTSSYHLRFSHFLPSADLKFALAINDIGKKFELSHVFLLFNPQLQCEFVFVQCFMNFQNINLFLCQHIFTISHLKPTAAPAWKPPSTWTTARPLFAPFILNLIYYVSICAWENSFLYLFDSVSQMEDLFVGVPNTQLEMKTPANIW